MSKRKREATDFWNKAAVEQGKLEEVKAEEYVRDVAHNKEGASAKYEKMQMAITTTPKVHPSRDE